MLKCDDGAIRPSQRIWELRGPRWPYTPPDRAEAAHHDGETRRRAPLEAPWRADARQLPHEQPEIGATDVHEQALQDVGMATQMHPTHPPGFVEMRVGTFQQLASLPQQLLPAGDPRIRRRLVYTACWAAARPFQLRRPRSGSET